MKRVYFVRHAESEANIARVHGGPHHPLSEKGKRQAEFVAERCSKLSLDAIFSSDAVRAKHTADILSARTGLASQVRKDLYEVRLPSSMMERSFDTQEAIQAENDLIEHMAPGYKHSDEETFDEMNARAKRVLEWLGSLSQERICIVTHGLFLRCLVGCAIFGDMNPKEHLALWRGLKSENTGLTVLEYRPDTPKRLWRLLTWNDHAHLG